MSLQWLLLSRLWKEAIKEAATRLPRFVKSRILKQDQEGLAVRAPEANAYEFQSGGVMEMLETLLDKFIAERITSPTAFSD